MLAKYYLLEEITSNLAALAVAQVFSLSSNILFFHFFFPALFRISFNWFASSRFV